MPIIVQKFGGTSVANSEKILAAARKAIRAQQQGNQVVMVVSAMGKNTDVLIGLAHEISRRPPAREMDMLLSTGEQVSVALMAMAIDSLGYKAVSLTGAQIGIKTDSTHTKARIRSISTERMQQLLDAGNIVIAAGFQGIDENYNITTLGRGGSDTTAVALAAVLGASCEIYTDVDGVYTTDPRRLPLARRVRQISYDEMLELASLGAGVMHNRSIEFAKKFGVAVHVRSSLTDTPGTWIVADPETPGNPVCGAAMTTDEARVTILDVPDIPGISHEIFSRIADRNVTVDMIVQNVGQQGKASISFTVPRDELDITAEAMESAMQLLGDAEVSYDENVSKISVVGLGMAHQTGVANNMFKALAGQQINIDMITTSEIKISVLVDREQAQSALRAVHETFGLDREPNGASRAATGTPSTTRPDPVEVVSRLQGVGMEGLLIDDISLDLSQARVTINGVPNAPGIAAKVFEQIADAGIFVDMIVQSYGSEELASLSFTVPKDSVEGAILVAGSLADDFNCQSVTSSPHVAKLSASGVGLRSHTGVATGMFRALAAAGINVEMINTSEVRVTVVVAGAKGQQALACLQAEFADAFVR